ncbi:MAG: nitrite reductase (NADH) large subunit [Limisphaerales bacterium]|jgi:nitrite reductase (NADH) large subunit
MASARLVQGLSKHRYPYRVTVISAEHTFGYNRVLLPDLLSGHCAMNDLLGRGVEGRSEGQLNLDLKCGVEVEKVDLQNKLAYLSTGDCLGYKQLVFSTGSKVNAPAMPGIGLGNVLELRCLEDVHTLQGLVKHAAKVTVLGGGLLGLEAGKALLQQGLQVSVVHRGSHLMNRQLDQKGAELLQRKLMAQGFKFELGRSVVEVKGQTQVRSVVLDDGTEHSADILLLATGVQASDALAVFAGLECDHGIKVNDQLKASLPDVFALGECAKVSGTHHCLVEPVFHQADVLADNLCGGNARCDFPAPSTRLKISGVEVFSAGDVSTQDPEPDNEVSVVSDDVYRRLLFRQQVLYGAVLVGDSLGAAKIHQSIGERISPRDREQLAFGL